MCMLSANNIISNGKAVTREITCTHAPVYAAKSTSRSGKNTSLAWPTNDRRRNCDVATCRPATERHTKHNCLDYPTVGTHSWQELYTHAVYKYRQPTAGGCWASANAGCRKIGVCNRCHVSAALRSPTARTPCQRACTVELVLCVVVAACVFVLLRW